MAVIVYWTFPRPFGQVAPGRPLREETRAAPGSDERPWRGGQGGLERGLVGVWV